MHTFIVCGIFKNEGHILEEWVRHYLYHGAEHIYLVNDNSTDNYKQILEAFGDKVTLFENDIETTDVGRQVMIYQKFFAPIFSTSRWVAILDLDEFLYSPRTTDIKKVLAENDRYSQLLVDWLWFGSNGYIQQPPNVVKSFTKRAIFNTEKEVYSYKSIFKPEMLIKLDIHKHTVKGDTYSLQYDETNPPDLVINHYNLQSFEFYTRIKATRGDVNNWFNTRNLQRNEELFRRFDINEIDDTRLRIQNDDITSS